MLLNLVRTGTATTRQDLERYSELGRASVTDRLTTLTQLGLLREGELGIAAGGRAPRHMEFCAEAAIVPVSIIEPSSLAVGLADLGGNLIAEHHEAIDLAAAGPKATFDRLSTLFTWMIEENTGPAWGIGVALPGAIERTEPFAVPAVRPIQSWGEFPFAEELTTRFRVPVFVRGGTQAMTMGEYRLGTAASRADMLFVNLGRTVSAGVISEGRLHRGAQGAAGLIGSTIVDGQALDASAGAEAISAEALRAARSGESRYLSEVLARSGDVSAVDVGHGAELDDEFSRTLLSRVGRLVGEALAPLANLLNPSLIILSGSVAQTGDTVLAAVREAVYRKSHPLVTRDLQITRSQLGGSGGLSGIAQVVVEELFAPKVLREWVALGSPLKSARMTAALETASSRLSPEAERPAPPARTALRTGKRGGTV
jgi:predicted NBD/HSP70 family sugar kinase